MKLIIASVYQCECGRKVIIEEWEQPDDTCGHCDKDEDGYEKDK